MQGFGKVVRTTVKTSLSLGFVLFLLLPCRLCAAGPTFTEIKRSLESAPVTGAKVLYWDQVLADDLGVVTAAGRVGQKPFEESVLQQIAVLIKENPEFMNGSQSEDAVPAAPGQTKFIEVELDAHGGAGRAGYIKLKGRDGKDLWLNLKGVGLTGLGNAEGLPPGPPLETWGDHSDGSADLPEGVVEALNAQIAYNDLKYRAGRVLSLVTVNKNLNLQSGEKYPLVIIVRAPMRRMDQELRSARNLKQKEKAILRIVDSIGQANAMRIFKGDLVNRSNIGAGGEFIDFGLFNVVNGFVPATNHLKVKSFKETTDLFGKDKIVTEQYRFATGFYLLNQMGLEESRIKTIIEASPRGNSGIDRAKIVDFANRFVELVYQENATVDSENGGPAKAKAHAGNFRLHHFFRAVVKEIVMFNGSRDELVERLYGIARTYNASPTFRFSRFFKRFARPLVDIVLAATADVHGNADYASKVERIARFKNRDVQFMDKLTLRDWSVDVMKSYRDSGDATAIQNSIDEAVNISKLSTGGFSTSKLRVTADQDATYIDIKADVSMANRTHRLFSYPELGALASQKKRSFRLSLDGKKTYTALYANLIQTELGNYYRISVPHGKFPVTTEITSIIPMIDQDQVASAVEITAPPLFLNERLGLSGDFARIPSLMRTRYGIKTDVATVDITEQHPATIAALSTEPESGSESAQESNRATQTRRDAQTADVTGRNRCSDSLAKRPVSPVPR